MFNLLFLSDLRAQMFVDALSVEICISLERNRARKCEITCELVAFCYIVETRVSGNGIIDNRMIKSHKTTGATTGGGARSPLAR